MAKSDEDGEIQVTIPYRLYRQLHGIARLANRTPESILEDALEEFLMSKRIKQDHTS